MGVRSYSVIRPRKKNGDILNFKRGLQGQFEVAHYNQGTLALRLIRQNLGHPSQQNRTRHRDCSCTDPFHGPIFRINWKSEGGIKLKLPKKAQWFLN